MFLKGKDLWSHIDGSSMAPVDAKELRQWETKDAEIISWILGSIEAHMVPKEALAGIQEVYEDSRHDQFLMKLRLDFEVALAGLLNKNLIPSLSVCPGELLHKEQRLATQAVLSASQEQSAVVNVAYVAQEMNRGKGQMQCYSCKKFGHITRNCAFCTCALQGHGKTISSPWFVNFGAFNRMIGSPDLLHNLLQYTGTQNIQIANGNNLLITAIGDIGSSLVMYLSLFGSSVGEGDREGG
ncbi:hypothetical protein L6164_026334 [Bauhinia variegata]|uniref:Uncharacterized protein n=1 Tax=Bauhinia variegata TaxID=167791 RepID=A0ACB9LQ29_BAUVA|nr:hypothetical protein L6164_026334 [Bauhinia variegata]